MNATTAETLVCACRTAVGDSLRSITRFSPRGYEQVYLRSDLARDADIDSFVAVERSGFASREVYEDTELGDYRFTVRSFENGYVTRIITGEVGVFVTTDPVTVPRFRELATAVEGVLD